MVYPILCTRTSARFQSQKSVDKHAPEETIQEPEISNTLE